MPQRVPALRWFSQGQHRAGEYLVRDAEHGQGISSRRGKAGKHRPRSFVPRAKANIGNASRARVGILVLILGNLGLSSEKQAVLQFWGGPGQQASENCLETPNQAFLPKSFAVPILPDPFGHHQDRGGWLPLPTTLPLCSQLLFPARKNLICIKPGLNPCSVPAQPSHNPLP